MESPSEPKAWLVEGLEFRSEPTVAWIVIKSKFLPELKAASELLLEPKVASKLLLEPKVATKLLLEPKIGTELLPE